MRIVTAKELAVTASDRWLKQYINHENWRVPMEYDSRRRTAQDIHVELLGLGFAPSPEDVTRVIGNDSWSMPQCDECHERRREVIAYEDADICKSCLFKGLALLTEERP